MPLHPEIVARVRELLTAEQFRQIIERLRSDVPSRGSIEKRNAPRVGMRTKLQSQVRETSG